MGMLMHHSLMRSAGEEPDKRPGEPIADSLSFEKPDLPQSGLYQAVGEQGSAEASDDSGEEKKTPAKKTSSRKQ